MYMVMMSYRSLYIKYKVHIQSDTRQLSTLNRSPCMLLCNVYQARTNQTHTKREYTTCAHDAAELFSLIWMCMCNVLIF